MPNSLIHTASSRVTQKQVTAVVPHHHSGTKQRNAMEQLWFAPYVQGWLASTELWCIWRNSLKKCL